VKYVLDTNAVSALMKGNAPIIERLASHAPADIAIPQPVLAELAHGIERLPRSRRRSTLQGRFDLICSDLARVEWTDDVSQTYGRIKAALERRGTRVEMWTGLWTVPDDAPIGRLSYTVSATDRFGRTAMFAPFPNLESQLTIVE
jgi:tRNA(fMet)-specific endonuclease VapC